MGLIYLKPRIYIISSSSSLLYLYMYSAFFMRNTCKCALHSIAATKAHVHSLPVQMQRDLTRGTDRGSPKRVDRVIRDRHVRRTMRLALTSHRQPGSLMCMAYSADIYMYTHRHN